MELITKSRIFQKWYETENLNRSTQCTVVFRNEWSVYSFKFDSGFKREPMKRSMGQISSLFLVCCSILDQLQAFRRVSGHSDKNEFGSENS